MYCTEILQDLKGIKYSELMAKIQFEEYNGDCCGHARIDKICGIPEDIDASDLTFKGAVRIDYEENELERQRTVVNFVFYTSDGREVVLGYEMLATSCSGWSYGACAKIKYDNDVIASVVW